MRCAVIVTSNAYIDDAHAASPRDTPDRPRRHPRIRARHVVFALLALVVLGVVGTVVAAYAMAPRRIRTEFERAVHEQCTECVVRVGSMDVSLLRGRVSFRDLSIADPAPTPRVVIRAREFFVDVAPLSLVRGTRHVERVLLRDAHAYLVARKPPHRASVGVSDGRESRATRVDRIDVEGLTVHVLSRLSREIDSAPQVRVDDIRGTIGAFGSSPGVVREPTRIEASARLQGQGDLRLTATADPARPDLPAHIDADLRGFELGRLAPYMTATARQHATGHVDHAHASMVMRGQNVGGTLTARYRDFELHFDASPDRPALLTSFMNVGERFFTDRSDDGHDGHEPAARIQSHRSEGKPLIDFLLEAILQATERLVRS